MITLGRVRLATSRRAVPRRGRHGRPARTRRAPSRTSRSARTDACWRRTTSTASRSSTPRRTPSVRSIKAAEPDGSFDAAWSPDGTRLAVTGTGAAMVELYDTATWQLVAPERWAADRAVRRPSGAVRRDRPQRSRRDRAGGSTSPERRRVLAGLDASSSREPTTARSGRGTRRTGAPDRAPAAARRARPRPGVQPGLERARGRLRGRWRRGPRRGVRPGRVDAALHGEHGRRATAAPGGGRVQPRRDGPRDGRRYGRRPVLGRDDRARRSARASSRRPAGSSTSHGRRRATTLVSSGTDGTVRLIDVATKTVAGVLPGLENEWVDATPSPDGSRLYVAYANGQAFDWAIDPAVWARDACDDRRSHPDAGGMGPVPAEPPVRPRLHAVTR